MLRQTEAYIIYSVRITRLNLTLTHIMNSTFCPVDQQAHPHLCFLSETRPPVYQLDLLQYQSCLLEYQSRSLLYHSVGQQRLQEPSNLVYPPHWQVWQVHRLSGCTGFGRRGLEDGCTDHKQKLKCKYICFIISPACQKSWECVI